MIKKHLTPGLMAMVAMTVPLAIAVKANAQTTDSHPQTTEVLTVATNQPETQNLVKGDASENPASYPLVAPIVGERESHKFSPLIKALKSNSASVDQGSIVVPKATITPITAKA